jgi:mono/diheme cytochrome c family protein
MPVMSKLALAGCAGLCAQWAVGGWAVISVERLPDYLMAGSTYTIEYKVRQHGVTLLTGLSGSVQIRDGTDEAGVARATGGATPGSYAATFRVPDADSVTLAIHSGFSGNGWGDLTLMPIPVVRANQARPTFTLAERGHRLFVAKGCGTCHVNGDVAEFAAANRVIGVGPELTGRRLAAAYVRQRLTDPASLPKLGDGPVRMPNLALAPEDVDALVALVSGSSERAAR